MHDDQPEPTVENGTRGSNKSRSTALSRRAFLLTGSATGFAAMAGCLGAAEDSDESGREGPNPPWTTEELRDYIADDAEVTIYAANGDKPTWESLVDVINDEFDTAISLNQYNAHAGAVSQRFLQERQAGKDKADVITTANDITAMIREDGRDVAGEYYETGLEENFWFADVLGEDEVLPWMVHSLNGGAWSVMPINEDVFEERGLDYPTSYNDLFDDQYEGLRVGIPGYIVDNQVGWIIGYHAEQTEMDELEWMSSLIDHLAFEGVESHSTGARAVAQGDLPMMFYNFPSTIQPLIGEYPLRGNFVDPVMGSAWKTELSINKKAPHPWVARFIVSAAVEEPVQRRIVHEVPQVAPGRTDLDYSPQDPSPYMEKRLNANTIPYSFAEGEQFLDIGQRAKEEGVFEY